MGRVVLPNKCRLDCDPTLQELVGNITAETRNGVALSDVEDAKSAKTTTRTVG